MEQESNEVELRRKALIQELKFLATNHERAARRYEWLISGLFYSSMIFGGLAVVSGIIKTIVVPTEIISIFAAIATGSTLLLREAKYRAKADWHYTFRDVTRQLSAKLDFELPIPFTGEDIAAISSEWRNCQENLGKLMATIHKSGSSTGRGE